MHKSLTKSSVQDPVECNQDTCSIEHFPTHHVIWFGEGTPWEYISGGFAVTRRVETGRHHLCEGKQGQHFAVWKKVGTTAYTVEDIAVHHVTGNKTYGTHILWTPNADNRGSYYYCVYGKQYVAGAGDRWLDRSPNQPGGPPPPS